MSAKPSPSNIAASRTRYGSVIGAPTLELNLKIGKAIKIIVAGDGKVSEAEMREFMDMGTLFGLTEAQVSEFVSFDPHSTKLEACLDGLSNDAYGRRMIYDAIKISSADGYADGERAAVRKAAKILGVDNTLLVTIEGIVEAELALAKMRATLFAAK